MRQVHNRVAMLIHLVKDVVAEELDDIPVSRLRPTWLASKSNNETKQRIQSSAAEHPLWSLVDEPKLA